MCMSETAEMKQTDVNHHIQNNSKYMDLSTDVLHVHTALQ